MIYKLWRTRSLSILDSIFSLNKMQATMSKFLLTGAMMVLLASFLHYSPSSNRTTTQSVHQEMTIYPIGEQIKIARSEKKMSQKDLAEYLNCSRLTIERIESGQVMPTKPAIEKLKVVLGSQLSMNGY
jgi:DNA-binding transcriptional regulator YiaG